jgi:hypothetical protein
LETSEGEVKASGLVEQKSKDMNHHLVVYGVRNMEVEGNDFAMLSWLLVKNSKGFCQRSMVFVPCALNHESGLLPVLFP